ncbi:MAG: DUF262 domain-containing protein [Promethearchaeota archaeon]|jgi:uncharacterized protein with ParB-like and HNH nuclease domain
MKKLEISKTSYKVSDFLTWQKAGTLTLSPSFQRRPVWETGAKSYLIDTVVRGLPMPIIFLREQKSNLSTFEPNREVVDGQQRIRTLISFIEPSLLKDLNIQRDIFTVKKSHNKELYRKAFLALPTDIQQQILDYEFSTHILPSGIDDREVLEIFARMNATGVKLNEQELRNAEYYGELKTSLYKIASEQLNRWRDWGIFTENNIARMQEVEITSEFAMLMIKGLTGKTQASINQFYKAKDAEFPERTEVERRFRFIMDTIDNTLGNDLKYLPFSKKTLFYHLFTILYHYHYGLKSSLAKTTPKSITPKVVSKLKLVAKRLQDKTVPEAVLESATRRTTNIDTRTIVCDYLKKEITVG